MNLKLVSSISALLFIQASAYATNPVNGWYGGAFIGVSDAPSSNFTPRVSINIAQPNIHFSVQSGSLPRSVLGDVGGEIGYRFCDHFRVEGELLYNNNPFSTLRFQNITLISPFYNTPPLPNSRTFNNVENSSSPHIQGEVNTGAFMVNGYYDFLPAGQDYYSNITPFIGGGLGISYVQNSLQFYNSTNSSGTPQQVFSALQERTTWAAQGIIGLSYFMDDFAWFSIDVRYFQTGSSAPKTTYTFITPNAVFTTHSSFNLFGQNTQLVSANLTFNGVFSGA